MFGVELWNISAILLVLDTSINYNYLNITDGQWSELFRTLSKKSCLPSMDQKSKEKAGGDDPLCLGTTLPACWPPCLEASQPTSSTNNRHCTNWLYMAGSYFSPVPGVVLLMNVALTEDPQSYRASQSPKSLVILSNTDHLLMYCSCLDSKTLRSVLALYFIATWQLQCLLLPQGW